MYIRADQTRRTIREAFFACMGRKPVKDITVAEICQSAGLNRSTFYKHYKSTADIIRELEQEQLDKFRILFETEDRFGKELIDDVLNLIEENRRINEAAHEKILSDGFISEMAEIAKGYAYEDWKKKMPRASEQEVDLALRIIISAALQVVVNEMGKYDRETIIKFIKNLMDGCVKMYA